jgi:hypothetical protein
MNRLKERNFPYLFLLLEMKEDLTLIPHTKFQLIGLNGSRVGGILKSERNDSLDAKKIFVFQITSMQILSHVPLIV